MINHDPFYRIKELSDRIYKMESEMNDLKNRSKDGLWNNSDMMLNWQISQRTLATWRSEGLIDYVQLGSKIWYTKESRDEFIMNNLIRGERKSGEGSKFF